MASRAALATSAPPAVDRYVLETISSRVTINATFDIGAVGEAECAFDGAFWTMRACARSSVLDCAPILRIGDACSKVATRLSLSVAVVHPRRDVGNAHLCESGRGCFPRLSRSLTDMHSRKSKKSQIWENTINFRFFTELFGEEIDKLLTECNISIKE